MVWYNPYTWFPKTTASILSSLHNLVAELEGHAAVQSTKVAYHTTKAEDHKDQANAAASETLNALSVAGKVRALIEPGDVGATRG